MSRREVTPFGFIPDPVYDDFGRVINFDYDQFNNLIQYRIPHPRRAFWSKGEPFGPLDEFFKQILYEPLPDTKPKLVLAMEGAILDIGEDIQQVFNELGPSIKCWLIVKVH